MNEYAIISDSCCDLPFDLAQKMEIRDVPMNISINNTFYQAWLDRREMKPSEFVNYPRLKSRASDCQGSHLFSYLTSLI